MNIKIGVFAVEKVQLLFEDFKISVRKYEPGVAHEKHSLPPFYYTERWRESQSVCGSGKGTGRIDIPDTAG